MVRAALLLLAACLALDASAQFSRRDRAQGGSPRETYRESPRATVPDDPFSSVERELPSLKVDLKLTGSQVDAWNAFERDVRDIADMDRARRKRLMALRGAEEKPSAIALVTALADEDRNRAEVTSDLRKHVEALYALLDDKQKQMLDRRLVMSQTEPLGR